MDVLPELGSSLTSSGRLLILPERKRGGANLVCLTILEPALTAERRIVVRSNDGRMFTSFVTCPVVRDAVPVATRH